MVDAFRFSENEGLYSRLREDTFGSIDHAMIQPLSPVSPTPLLPFPPSPLILYRPFLSRFRQTELSFQDSETDTEIVKEIKSKNENFMKDKNIKYNLYPLYINWKKIERKVDNNVHYNIFKLFGYFGEAIFNMLINNNNNSNYFNHKNFLRELNSYNKNYTKSEIMEKEFLQKLISIYDIIISLIKNRIIIFKEISVFLIILRLYESYYLAINDNDKILEVLKYQFYIIYLLKDDEYKIIYDKYYKKLDAYSNNYNPFSISSSKKFPKSKKCYINYIRSIYKKTRVKIKKEN